MPRPTKERAVGMMPPWARFKPAGIPIDELEDEIITVEEMEALRLADLDGLDQDQASQCMDISKPTFCRVLMQARQKVARALWQAKCLQVEGGNFRLEKGCSRGRSLWKCASCGNQWIGLCARVRCGGENRCPVCGGEEISLDTKA